MLTQESSSAPQTTENPPRGARGSAGRSSLIGRCKPRLPYLVQVLQRTYTQTGRIVSESEKLKFLHRQKKELATIITSLKEGSLLIVGE